MLKKEMSHESIYFCEWVLDRRSACKQNGTNSYLVIVYATLYDHGTVHQRSPRETHVLVLSRRTFSALAVK